MCKDENGEKRKGKNNTEVLSSDINIKIVLWVNVPFLVASLLRRDKADAT